MYMKTEIVKILEGGLEKNPEKVKRYAKLMIDKLMNSDEKKFAERLKKILEKESSHPVYLDDFLLKPKDKDSNLEMVDVTISSTKETRTQLVIPEFTEKQVDDYISSLEKKDELIKIGIDMPNSLLLYGPPGSGKTSIAHLIAESVGLPLVTAKLDGMVSSLLGSTAKNIRKIFDYAKERPCILFLDEFDAIAKARDDSNEVGELKRVVNSLLQNIDEFNKESILIAATNHEKLLDPAVWRRFTNKIEVPYPSNKEVEELILLFLNNLNIEYDLENKKLKILGGLLSGESPSEIKILVYNAIKNSIISGTGKVKYIDLLKQVYTFNGNFKRDNSLIIYLNKNGISQNEISEHLNLSIRQVRKEIENYKGGELNE